MPAYHSTFLAEEQQADSSNRVVGNLVLLPFHSKFRGPTYPPDQEYDIIEETLDLFRANSFFRNFEIKGGADRLLIYGILFISDCLNKLNKTMPIKEGQRVLLNLALEDFKLPGDIGFPLNNLYLPPKGKNEADLLRSYLSQFRQELSDRLLNRIYQDQNEGPSKHWLAFTKRRFMNKSL
ncbi:Actin-related protein 2/3 complex subunit 3 [Spathaspora sp. JA1]|nr:Actin-related protein 2/3 complex subunit 3 [Spathaspora sp. JA1]